MPIEVRGLAPLLQVYDMPTSIHFYRDLLGFELVQHAPEYAPGRSTPSTSSTTSIHRSRS